MAIKLQGAFLVLLNPAAQLKSLCSSSTILSLRPMCTIPNSSSNTSCMNLESADILQDSHPCQLPCTGYSGYPWAGWYPFCPGTRSPTGKIVDNSSTSYELSRYLSNPLRAMPSMYFSLKTCEYCPHLILVNQFSTWMNI